MSFLSRSEADGSESWREMQTTLCLKPAATLRPRRRCE